MERGWGLSFGTDLGEDGGRSFSGERFFFAIRKERRPPPGTTTTVSRRKGLRRSHVLSPFRKKVLMCDLIFSIFNIFSKSINV